MFVDDITLELEAGNGGNGCLAFRREKYIEMGGPWGGNGGRGSDIVFQVDEGLSTLLDLRYQKKIKGKNGENGMGKGMHGRNAEKVIIKVPPGTIVTDSETGYVIADLTKNKEEKIIAAGGRGGRGNIAFATHKNPAPNFCENGEPGEKRKVKVELKLLADVGLVGMPSVGKSTLISKISASKPKIAAYHFTTLKPNLGVVKTKDNRSFVVADLPGLIKGASKGEGLGDTFLKHIERTRVIAHILDMSAYEGRDPFEDYQIIRGELEAFSEKLIQKPEIVIANKMDIPSAKENLKKCKEKIKAPIFEISALENQGIDKVLLAIADLLDKTPKENLIPVEKMESHIVYTYKEEKPFHIEKENDAFVIFGKEVERLLHMTKFQTEESVRRFSHQLKKMGIDESLKKMGAQTGDTVRILDFEFEFKE